MASNIKNVKFEDTIHCSFFPKLNDSSELNILCEEINTLIDSLAKDQIWHRDEFKVCVSVFDNEKIGIPTHITSTTCFGDNIEDEWFIVYLVLQITNQYKDIVVNMEDNDGSFLLIEAADYLPLWANPDTTENRVFIYRNQIHLIPPEIIELDSKLDLLDAINLVRQRPEDTRAATKIQEAVIRRISCYPQKIKDNQHRALVTLPEEIAALLTLKPSLISPIVTTYCNHDTVDAKCFQFVNFERCVTVPILFTKYLYAMLMHSKLPRLNKFPRHSSNNKETTLGWKLACGYEIIMSKSSKDIFSSTAYNKFINSLTEYGYFKYNIMGSKQYNELLDKAKIYFSNMECPLSLYYCNKISNLKKTEKFTIEKAALKDIEFPHMSNVDTEEWLNVNPDELNTFLNTHYGKKIVQNENSTTPQIKSKLASFLKQTSDFEGIEYIEKNSSDENEIDFDSDQFVISIKKMLNLITDNNSEESGSDSDFNEDMMVEEDFDGELASKLQNSQDDNAKNENIIKNLLQSLKEEGISGPTSTLLKNLVNKKEI